MTNPQKRKSLRVKNKEATVELVYNLNRNGCGTDVIKLGQKLMDFGLDGITDGFWILKGEIEYYSPGFRKTLGFENEIDFPNVPASWQGSIEQEYLPKATEDYMKHLADPDYEYYLDVVYRKKGGGKVRLICAGTIVNREHPDDLIMIGTHEIIDEIDEIDSIEPVNDISVELNSNILTWKSKMFLNLKRTWTRFLEFLQNLWVTLSSHYR